MPHTWVARVLMSQVMRLERLGLGTRVALLGWACWVDFGLFLTGFFWVFKRKFLEFHRDKFAGLLPDPWANSWPYRFPFNISRSFFSPMPPKLKFFSSRCALEFFIEAVNGRHLHHLLCDGVEEFLGVGSVGKTLGGGGVISITLSPSPSSSLEFKNWFPTLSELSEKDPPPVVSFFSTKFFYSTRNITEKIFHHEGFDTTDGMNKVKTKDKLVDSCKGIYHLRERM